MKTLLFRKHNRLISFLLSILGFGAACSVGSCEYGTPYVEYGTPHAEFRVKGVVRSEATSNTLPNIRVVMGTDTGYTDASGQYELEQIDFPDDQTFLIEFSDVDGATNGEYQSLDTLANFIDPEFTGTADGWYNGYTEKEVNIDLRDKE